MRTPLREWALQRQPVYIDEPVYRRPNGRKRYAHLVIPGGTRGEHLTFAWAAWGAGNHVLHTRPFLHVDVPEEHVAECIRQGARQVTARELVRMVRQNGAGAA